VTPLRAVSTSSTIALWYEVTRHVAHSMSMEEVEILSTHDMAAQAEVAVRTVQRWIKSGKLKAEVLRHGKYRIHPLDLIELSLTATERAKATPKNR